MKCLSFASRSLRMVVVGISLFGLGGCQWFQRSAPAPLPAPRQQWTTSHFAGNALSGPRPTPQLGTEPWPVTLHAWAITRLPTSGFDPVGPLARLVVSSDTTAVVTPSSRVVYSARFKALPAEGGVSNLIAELAADTLDPTQSMAYEEARGAVVVGSTARFTLNLPTVGPDASEIEFLISRRTDADGIELCIASESPTTSGTSSQTVRELILIDRQLESGVPSRFAVLVPVQFAGSPLKGVLAVIEVNPSDVPDDDAWALASSQIDEASRVARERAETRLPSGQDVVLSRAVQAIEAGGPTRGSLGFLADLTGAELSRIVIGVADDKVIDLIGTQVQSRLANLPQRDGRSVAWLIDRSTVAALASVKPDESEQLLTPIQGALSIYAGEAGRQLDVLFSLAGESANSEDLMNRIIAEHFILLEETSPALRVRAFDWLWARGKAPAGYDPLATAKERRAALERYRAEQAATQAAPNSGN